MRTKVMLGLMLFTLLLSVSPVLAQTGHECRNGDLYTNTTINGDEVEVVTECANGCAPLSGGKYTCATTSFVISPGLYIFFEVIAFIFFLSMLAIHYMSQRGNPFPFALLSMIMFAALGMASFNVSGVSFLMGSALNFSLFMFSLAFVILDSIDQIPSRL